MDGREQLEFRGEQDGCYSPHTVLESSLKVIIDKKKIELAEPIRHLGTYDVAIKLGKDIVTKIKVTVAAEEAA